MEIIGRDIDELVYKGIQNVLENGVKINSRSGFANQVYNISYVLNNSRNRLHFLRHPTSTVYMCRELLAYFRGGLNVNDGLLQASSFWGTLADPLGRIQSNYGHYVFHQKAGEYKNQYAWVIATLMKNKFSRRAIININQPFHKTEVADFPCCISIQFYIQADRLCCQVYSRSLDVITGLPYDMCFFSFLNELVHANLIEESNYNIKLGTTTIDCTFSQVYEKTKKHADKIATIIDENKPLANGFAMPKIGDYKIILKDIENDSSESELVKWIYVHAMFE